MKNLGATIGVVLLLVLIVIAAVYKAKTKEKKPVCPDGWKPFVADGFTRCFKSGYSSGEYDDNAHRCSLPGDTRYSPCS